jgi:hypothetical protein
MAQGGWQKGDGRDPGAELQSPGRQALAWDDAEREEGGRQAGRQAGTHARTHAGRQARTQARRQARRHAGRHAGRQELEASDIGADTLATLALAKQASMRPCRGLDPVQASQACQGFQGSAWRQNSRLRFPDAVHNRSNYNAYNM